jgi:phosphoribosylaminoimidazole-succinocarboxamide synthase
MYAYDLQMHATSNTANPLLHTDCPGMTLMRRGKSKDIYDLGDMLLMVSTDRLPAAGKTLGQGVSGKGKMVNQLSAYWFRRLRSIFPNHLVSANPACFPESIRNYPEVLEGRAMLVWRATPLPVRCVVRGYLAGDAWQEYREKGEICGTKLPVGLVESQRLPCPIFAPTAKGRPGATNDNIDFGSLQNLLGKSLAEQLRETSLRLYFNAWQIARERGVLIADTTFQFGLHDTKLMLIDECLTPDTSRFWGLDSYRYGGFTPGIDKQIVIDCLNTLEQPDNISTVPDEVLRRIGLKYSEVFSRIVGKRTFSRLEVL